MTVDVVIPAAGRLSAADLLGRIEVAAALPPFSPEAVAALAELSRRLLADPAARRRPDLQALGYWLRPAALARLEADFRARLPRRAEAVPRGLALLLPPANVEVIAVYGWALSLLAGNRSIVRLSERWQGGDLLRLTAASLFEHPAAAAVSTFVRYGHDDAVTAALSRRAELRIAWGGDETTAHLRRLPRAPRGLDLGFPDRRSLAAIAAAAYAASGEPAREALAEGFANDLFWFDQRACASPALLVWIGAAEQTAAAAADFAPRVAAAARRRGFLGDAASHVARLIAIHRAALDLPVERLDWYGTALAVLRLAAPQPVEAAGLSGGAILEAAAADLGALAAAVTGRTQTLAVFGFPEHDLRALVRLLNGRGIDRIVPIGQALRFDAVWDGVDMMASLTRLVTVDMT